MIRRVGNQRALEFRVKTQVNDVTLDTGQLEKAQGLRCSEHKKAKEKTERLGG